MNETDIVNTLLERVEQLSYELGRERMLKEQVAISNLKLRGEISLMEPKIKADLTKGMEDKICDLIGVCLSKPRNKLAQIKGIRDLTGINIKGAKDLLEKAWERVGEPWTILPVQVSKEVDPCDDNPYIWDDLKGE